MRVTAECVDWEKGDPIYLLIYDDITKLTEQRELLQQTNIELERLAYEDPVTGGMNRTRFDMVAGDAISRAGANSYALVWLNMQRFKLINDIAGNEMGDSTLRYVYEKINLHLREGEFLARITADNYSLDVYKRQVHQCRIKKPEVDVSLARFETFTEGLCVQMMHIGPYSKETATIEALHRFMEENGLANMTGNVRKHHEIYLGDPRRTAPEKLKTVIRLPVEKE